MRDGTPTKEKLRREALRLFVARGVDAVSVRDLADAVGVRPSTLYVHWPSKDALVTELFTAGYAAYGRRLAAIHADGFRPRLAAMVREICRLHDEDRTLFQFLLLTQHGCLARVALPSEDNPVAVLHSAVESAVAAGEVDGDPTLLTAGVVGIVVQAATFHLYGSLPRSLAEAADDIVTLCLRLVTP